MSKLFFYTMMGAALVPTQALAQATQDFTDNLVVTSSDSHQEFALDSVSNLQQRNGELYNPQIAACIPGQEDLIFPKGQLWTRALYSNLQTPLKQGSSTHKTREIQLGADLLRSFDKNNQSRQTAGVMVAFAQSNSHLNFNSNTLVPAALLNQEAKTDHQAVALYYTHYTVNGEHIDGVAQWSQSKSKDSRSISTGAYQSESTSVSVQWGKPFKIRRSNWLIEPQAQLLAQQTHFYDLISESASFSSYRSNLVRLKVGARAVWNGDVPELTSKLTKGDSDWRPTTYYLGAYLVQDVVKSESASAQLALQDLSTEQKPWLELTAGAQQPIGHASYLYGQISYQKSLSGNQRKATTGNLGLRVNW
jgi:outer membrane autotransporter protein